MAKKADDHKETQDTLELNYILGHLPSAQHKTGLAGLIFLLDTMEKRKIHPLPEVSEESGGVWKFRFTRESFQKVFDELYDAETIEVESPTKWNNADLIEIREKVTDKGNSKKTEKVFVYEVVVPKGAFLKGALPADDEGGKKLKLWRDMLWATYRGKPAARGVYNERAGRNPCSFADNSWSALQKKPGAGEQLAGSLLLGAEGSNAEGVPLKGTFEENLLLHFAHTACPLFVTRAFSVKRGNKENHSTYSVEWTEGGFVLVMPEIVDIRKYLARYAKWLGSQTPTTRHFRPFSSLIDLPEESGLEFLSAITERRVEKQGRGFFDTVEGVEYYYMVKKGNSVNLLASAYVPLSPATLDQYNHLVAPQGSKKPLNFLFKTCRIRNMLDGSPWYTGMESIFEQYPTEFFIWSREGSPRNTPFFGQDIHRHLKSIAEKIQIETEANTMGTNTHAGPAGIDRDERLASKTRSIVRQFVISELKERVPKDLPAGKTHLEWTKEDGDLHLSEGYRNALEKVCSGAFLALRGRKGADIAEFFTGTLCAHPQFLRNSSKDDEKDDYLLIAQSLVDPDEREKIKLFAMLALSACSYVYTKDEQEKTETK